MKYTDFDTIHTTPVFVIRVDASYDIGMGHNNRCRILRDNLSYHAKVILIGKDSVTDHSGYTPNDLISVDSVLSPDLWPEADACIVDLYEYSADYYRILSQKYVRIAIFDDCLFQVPEWVAAVINPNMYADSSLYPPGIKVFAGPQYYLLRPEFTECRPDSHNGGHLLICMGGSDPEGQTGRILTIARRITNRPIEVVFGASDHETLLVEYSRIPGVTVHKAVQRMRPLMERAVYAVVGAGTLLYELAYMGIPAACLCLAENQRMNAEAFEESMAALFIGHHRHVSDAAIAAALTRLEHEAMLRSTIRNNAQKLIDGHGADRLTKDIITWIKTGV